MKIMMVTPYFFPKVGGLENYAFNIAKGLQKQGHDVFVVTSNHDTKAYVDEVVQGMRVIRLPTLVQLSNTPVNPFWRWQLKKIIRQEKPNIINAHTPVPYLADMAVRAAGRTPVVLTYHNDLVKPNGAGKYLAKLFYALYINKTLRKADKIITTSEYYANTSPYLAKYTDKLAIVPPGIDTKRFNTIVSKTWLQKKYPGKQIVLFVGSLKKTHAHKGVDVLLKATAQAATNMPELQLVIAGDGDAALTYKNLAKKLGIASKVDFPGFVSEADLPKYYAGANLLVLPTTTSAEGFGMVIMEAAACGTPALGSNIGGIPYVIQDKLTGELTAPNSATNLASKLVNLLMSPAAMKRYSIAGAHRAKSEYSWAKQVSVTLNVLKRASQPKVILIHNVISPYRLPMFEAMSLDLQLTVLFCKPITKDRVWHYNLNQYTFDYHILSGFSVGPIIFNIKVIKLLKRLHSDVIITNTDPDTAPLTLLAILTAKLQRSKIIIWSEVIDENIHFFPSLAYSDKLIHKVMRKQLSFCVMTYRSVCFKSADRFVAFSEHAKNFLMRHGVPESRIGRTFEVMPLELLTAPQQTIKRFGKTFLYIGYLIERKNIVTLISAFTKLADPKIRLKIAGTGPLEKYLKEQAMIDPRISFVGYVEDDEKATLYASSDILVLPTLSDCWGLVINEAMHYGLGIICSNAAAASELISNKSGRVISPTSTPQLIKAMDELIGNSSTLINMQKYNSKLTNITDVNLAAKGFYDQVYEVVNT